MAALETRKLEEEGFDEALSVLRSGLSDQGFLASLSTPHYAGIWARDAAITMMGANLSEDGQLLDGSRRTLDTLLSLQTKDGQIPNTVWPSRGYWDFGEAGSVDATALVVVSAAQYYMVTRDESFLKSRADNLVRALAWLRHLDVSKFGLLDTPPASDWIDSSLWRFGKVFYVNVLYYQALRSLEALGLARTTERSLSAREVRERLNLFFWPREDVNLAQFVSHLGQPGPQPSFPHTASQRAYMEAAKPDRMHFLSHASFGSFVDVCDVLANCLAILFGVSSEEQTASILEFLLESGVENPFPARAFPKPVTQRNDRWQLLSEEADRHQAPQWKNPPYRFHNAGIWPFVGGFYVMALEAGQRSGEARQALARLAEANRQGPGNSWAFHEWLDGRTGEPGGVAQHLWSAGAYVAAFQMLRGKSPPLIHRTRT